MPPEWLSGLEVKLEKSETPASIKAESQDEAKFEQDDNENFSKEIGNQGLQCFLVEGNLKPDNNLLSKSEVKAECPSFACDQCGYFTYREAHLELHKKYKNHSVGSFVCEVCGTTFTHLQTLTRHKKRFHEEMRFQCSDCTFKAEDSDSLKRHCKYSHCGEKHKCNICEYKHSMLSRVKLHMAEKHGEKNILCDSCDFTCATKRGMSRHVFKKHTKCRKLFRCEKCDYSSINSYDVKRHFLALHDEAMYMCNTCSYVGSNTRSLQRHMKKHEGRIYKCENCEYSSLTLEQLKLHNKEKHCELVKCSECEHKCPSGWRMKRHLEAKHKNNLFKCPLCDFVASSKSLLVSHNTCVHTVFTCSICHHEERSRYLIDKHIATHSDMPEESFPCDKCSFVGFNKRSLQYHQKKHEGKSYFCGKCNYMSQTKAQLQSHINSKHGELKFQCEFCDFKFPCNWRLKQHTERRHSFKPVKSKKGRGKKGVIIEDTQSLYTTAGNDDSTLICEALVNITPVESEQFSKSDVDFGCSLCSFVGSNKTMLQDHRRKHRDLQYKCELCDFKCATLYRLRQHLKSKHEGKQRKTRKDLSDDEKFNAEESTLFNESELNYALDHIVNLEEPIFEVSVTSIM